MNGRRCKRKVLKPNLSSYTSTRICMERPRKRTKNSVRVNSFQVTQHCKHSWNSFNHTDNSRLNIMLQYSPILLLKITVFKLSNLRGAGGGGERMADKRSITFQEKCSTSSNCCYTTITEKANS